MKVKTKLFSIIVALDIYEIISVTVTGTKQGYSPVTFTTASTLSVKSATPKVSWVYPSAPLTSKSTLAGYAARSFGGTTDITKAMN